MDMIEIVSWFQEVEKINIIIKTLWKHDTRLPTLVISPSSITALLIFLNSSYSASISLTLTAFK